MNSADLLKKIAGGLMLGTALVAISAGSAMAQVTDSGGDTFAIDGTLSGDGSVGDPLGIADGGVGTDQLADDAVTQDKIADDAVGTDQLADDAVTQGKIADDAVGAAQIQDGAVGTDQLADDAVTQGKIADGAVGSAQIEDGSVTSTDFDLAEINASDALTGGAIEDGSIGAVDLLLGTSLAANGSGGLEVNLRSLGDGGSGLSITTEGLTIDTGTGLQLNTTTGAVEVDFSNGANGIRGINGLQGANALTQENLATDSVGSAQIQSGAVGFDELSKSVRNKIDENAEGVAIAMAVVNPDLTGSESFGMSFNYGNFEGSSALGFAVTGVLSRNVFGGGERLALSGGVGFGLDNDTTGGRVGAQITW